MYGVFNNCFPKNTCTTMYSPSDMISILNLKALQERRRMAKLKFLHKILHAKVDLHGSESIPSHARCSDTRLKPVFAWIQCYQFSYFPYTIGLWNGLPAQVVNVPDFDKFSAAL